MEHAKDDMAPHLETEHAHLQGLKAGVTEKKEKWGHVSVANGEGKARSHITLQGKWEVPPEVLFAIFTYPDNTALFRDIERVGQRRVLSALPGLKVVEVEQLQELKVLWIRRHYTTWLKVTEDSRDKECLTIQFDLMKSDVLAQFAGRWELTCIKDDAGRVVGCKGELNQDVLPKGVPSFMKHIPVLGDLLRGVTLRAINRVMEDMDKAVDKVKAGMDKGRAYMDVLRDLCGTCEEEGHANGAVASFAVDDMEDEDEEEAEEGEESASAQAAAALDKMITLDTPTEGNQPAHGGQELGAGPAADTTAAAGSGDAPDVATAAPEVSAAVGSRGSPDATAASGVSAAEVIGDAPDAATAAPIKASAPGAPGSTVVELVASAGGAVGGAAGSNQLLTV